MNSFTDDLSKTKMLFPCNYMNIIVFCGSFYHNNLIFNTLYMMEGYVSIKHLREKNTSIFLN